MQVCILTGEPIEASNDSKGHIIPSALGGRLKPKGLLTQKANTELNDKLDAPLIRALAPVMALLGGSRDSGKNPSTRMSTPDGKSYVVTHGQPIRPAHPSFEAQETDQGTQYQIVARTLDEARTLLGRVKAKHPSFDIDLAMRKAVIKDEYLSDHLHGQLELGPNRIFPGVFGIASLFSAHLGHLPHPDFRAYVDSLPKRISLADDQVKVSMPPDTFYWIPPSSPVARTQGVSHILAFFGDPSSQSALVYVELFNLPGIAVRLPYRGHDAEVHTYCIDVLTGEEKSATVDTAIFRGTPWGATHTLSEVFGHFRKSLEHILSAVHERARSAELERITEDVFGHGQPITPDMIAEFSSRVAAMMEAMLNRGAQASTD